MRTIVIIGIVLVTAGLEAQDQLRAAKDLYASAAYEDALATLSRLDGEPTAEIARQVDQYRVFSLYALGRTREAESIAESMIRKDPLARLDSADASPRLEQMFADVRKRLLPSLVRERFRTARSALDEKSFDAAEPSLTEARLMLVEAEKLGVKDDGLGDLSVLVDGFLQLIAEKRTPSRPAAAASAGTSVAAVTPPPVAPPPAPAAISVPVPVATSASTSPAPAPPPASASRPVSQLPARAGAVNVRVYSIEDEGVSPPVAIDQRMPAMSADMRVVIKGMHTNGVVDVTIDEAGRVVDATIRQSLNSSFDDLVVRTARRWKYQPAMKDGVPVRYVKTLLLVP